MPRDQVRKVRGIRYGNTNQQKTGRVHKNIIHNKENIDPGHNSFITYSTNTTGTLRLIIKQVKLRWFPGTHGYGERGISARLSTCVGLLCM